VNVKFTVMKQEYRHYYKKLARLLFDRRVVNTTYGVNDKFRRSHSVDNTCGDDGLTVTPVSAANDEVTGRIHS